MTSEPDAATASTSTSPPDDKTDPVPDDETDPPDAKPTDTPSPRLTFAHLPPELRHKIWRLAVPSAGINFFNVHCFPNDHEGCNRSMSPPWAYLDLRRLSIDDDDATVATYDPSAWQARHAVRQTCHEARVVCALPPARTATIRLTRPRRGLFVRAGDAAMFSTPYLETELDQPDAPGVEPAVRRIVEVDTEDMLCLSAENCSFSLPYEEAPSLTPGEGHVGIDGWAYDPQLMPPLPLTIPPTRICASIASWSMRSLHVTADALFGLLYSHIPDFLDPGPTAEEWRGPLMVMMEGGRAKNDRWDNKRKKKQKKKKKKSKSAPPAEGPDDAPTIVWDRFDDSYVWLPENIGYDINGSLRRFPEVHLLTKVSPEIHEVQERYLMSAQVGQPR